MLKPRQGRTAEPLDDSGAQELSRLRRENRQLRLEREILSKAAAWFARETNAIPAKDSGTVCTKKLRAQYSQRFADLPLSLHGVRGPAGVFGNVVEFQSAQQAAGLFPL
jgi:hypothetical protein